MSYKVIYCAQLLYELATVSVSRKEPNVVSSVCFCMGLWLIKMKYPILYIASFAFGGVGAWSVLWPVLFGRPGDCGCLSGSFQGVHGEQGKRLCLSSAGQYRCRDVLDFWIR